jgi:cell wall assembly regulator SMI1
MSAIQAIHLPDAEHHRDRAAVVSKGCGVSAIGNRDADLRQPCPRKLRKKIEIRHFLVDLEPK